VTRESRWREEWEVLRAERALARRRWSEAADGIAERARVPLGIVRLIRDHPVAAAGIGAAAGAILVKLLRPPVHGGTDGPPDGGEPTRPAPAWSTALRDAALGIAVPWILRMLEKPGDRAQQEE
jgi:hypothetical protein